MRFLVTILLSMLVLAACGNQSILWGAYQNHNPQNFAGGEEWSLNYKCPVDPASACLEAVRYVNYKDAAASQIAIGLADGTVLNFAGEDINGSTAIGLRAAVEEKLAEAGIEATDGLVDSILNVLVPGAN
jgi:hypothetical protein